MIIVFARFGALEPEDEDGRSGLRVFKGPHARNCKGDSVQGSSSLHVSKAQPIGANIPTPSHWKMLIKRECLSHCVQKSKLSPNVKA